MICEKCGENLPKGAKKCPNCSAGLAPAKLCGGFQDVLSIKDIITKEPAENSAFRPSVSHNPTSENKNTEQLLEYAKLNMLLSMIIAGVCVAVMILSIVFGALCLSKANSIADMEIEEKFEDLDKKLKELSAKVNNIGLNLKNEVNENNSQDAPKTDDLLENENKNNDTTEPGNDLTEKINKDTTTDDEQEVKQAPEDEKNTDDKNELK